MAGHRVRGVGFAVSQKRLAGHTTLHALQANAILRPSLRVLRSRRSLPCDTALESTALIFSLPAHRLVCGVRLCLRLESRRKRSSRPDRLPSATRDARTRPPVIMPEALMITRAPFALLRRFDSSLDEAVFIERVRNGCFCWVRTLAYSSSCSSLRLAYAAVAAAAIGESTVTGKTGIAFSSSNSRIK